MKRKERFFFGYSVFLVFHGPVIWYQNLLYFFQHKKKKLLTVNAWSFVVCEHAVCSESKKSFRIFGSQHSNDTNWIICVVAPELVPAIVWICHVREINVVDGLTFVNSRLSVCFSSTFYKKKSTHDTTYYTFHVYCQKKTTCLCVCRSGVC